MKCTEDEHVPLSDTTGNSIQIFQTSVMYSSVKGGGGGVRPMSYFTSHFAVGKERMEDDMKKVTNDQNNYNNSTNSEEKKS